MPSIDLSRIATNFRKRYAGVRMQMGRVLTDDDFNESERLDGEEERRALVHIIGATGSPDAGFLVANPSAVGGEVEFDITPGTLYLGGLRLEAFAGETFRTQRDWLNRPPAEGFPPPAAGRFDLVYVEAWQQPVTAVEDGELFEAALGGPDTSARIHNRRRLRVRAGVGAGDCRAAWADVLDALATQGTLNDELELVPDARLRVTFEPGGDPADLCSPPVAGGYLGAENQAVRVQLVDATRLTWGFDNAAPLYRVRVQTNAAGQRRVVEMLTEPKDQAHWPLAGQVVELLPWSAVLPNGERLSEVAGFLARVDGSYNPDTQRFAVAAAVPAGFGEEWKTRPDAAELGLGDDEFFYLRVWNRGPDLASPPAITFAPGTPVALGDTGLRVTFTGAQFRAGDFWVIAARPETPDRVVPWELEAGRAAHGYRRFYAPLAVIRWGAVDANLNATGQVVDDCRETFEPLTRLRGCCTYTVGDGVSSHGHFSSIQEAVDHLPAEGGEVCVLPGRYEGRVVIANRRNVKIHGCGRRSRLMPGGEQGLSLVAVYDSQNITIKSLAVESPDAVGVELRGGLTRAGRLEDVTLAELFITASSFNAVNCRGGRRIRLLHNRIEVAALRGALSNNSQNGKHHAVFIAADDVLVELNEIVVAPLVRRLESALGGIQIGGGSERVEIRRNLIAGGNGNGVTLGSIVYVRRRELERLEQDFDAVMAAGIFEVPGIYIIVDENGCLHIPFDPIFPDDDPDDPRVPVSEGAVEDVRIVDNEIALMGASGVATARFFAGAQGLITARDLTVELNHIHDCMQVQLGLIPAGFVNRIGFGGVALADAEDLLVRLNRIEFNGTAYADPICGVFVRQGEALVVEGNQILENGRATLAGLSALPGPRGGVVILDARAAVRPAPAGGVFQLTGAGQPAARVHENVVTQPVGRALMLVAAGPVSVHGNHLTSRGVVRVESQPTPDGTNQPAAVSALLNLLGGCAVLIFNVGVSVEVAGSATRFSNMPASASGISRAPDLDPATGAPRAVGGFGEREAAQATGIVVGGNVLFDDNQVLLQVLGGDGILGVSSVTLFSLDDVSLGNNQSDCEVQQRLLFNTLAFGWSLRATSNRFKEVPGRALFSALTFGLMNFTVDNVGTHCIVAVPVTPLVTDQPNHSLIELFNRDFCGRIGAQIAAALNRR